MQRFADSERVNERVQDRRAQGPGGTAGGGGCSSSSWWTTARRCCCHREVNGRLYTVLPGEETDLMDTLWNADAAQARTLAFKLSRDGLTDSLRSTYDSFVRACLDSFDPAKIILVRSHAAAVLDRGGRHDRADQRRPARRTVPRGAGRLLHRADRLPGGRRHPGSLPVCRLVAVLRPPAAEGDRGGSCRALHLAPCGRCSGPARRRPRPRRSRGR